jgi:23S rRNA C2498 (ribose-2'-O)-methylase RlmM
MIKAGNFDDENDDELYPSVLVVCGYARADRYREILEKRCKYEILAFSNSRGGGDNSLNKMTTHGGYVYARLKHQMDIEMQIQELHSISSFDRFCTSVFPIKFQYKCEKKKKDSIHSFLKTLAGKLIDKNSSKKVKIRLHVYANDNSSKKMLKQLTNTINEKYANQIELSPVNFDKVVVFVSLFDDIFGYNIITSNFFNYIMKNDKGESLVSRAAYKLLDGIELLKHRCIDVNTDLPALDVGSSPGGWTEALIAYGMKNVIAIDPAEMNKKLMKTGNVRHIKAQAQDAAKTLRKEMPSLKCSMIVCDVNTPIKFAINELIFPLIPFLNVGAPIVLTLKLPKRYGKDSSIKIATKDSDFARKKLKPYFKDIEIYHLLGNTACERTLIGVRNDRNLNNMDNNSSDDYVIFDVHKKWLKDFHNLQKFVNEENMNQLPFSNARTKKERRFAKWVNKQHDQYHAINRRGGWGALNIELLEKCNWWNWNTSEDIFKENIFKLKEWMKNNNNVLPKPYARSFEEGLLLAKFIESERRAYHISNPSIHHGTSSLYDKKHQMELESIDGFTWTYERKNNDSPTARSEDMPKMMQHNLNAKLNFLLGPKYQCKKCFSLFYDLQDYKNCFHK